MNCLNDLNGCELVTLANIIAVSLSQDLSCDEIVKLGGFFTVLGDSLAAISLSCDTDNKNRVQ